MIQIRTGVFETNSSGTHSLAICGAKDFEKFQSGEMVMFDGKIVSLEAAAKMAIEYRWTSEEGKAKLISILESSDWNREQILEVLNDDDADVYTSYSDYQDRHSEYEKFSKSYTTESGDQIVAFGYYGYDG